jgi:DNA-binding NtrC family response regulator
MLKYPRASLLASSARSIGATFESLKRNPPAELHVCGLGVYCDWDVLAAPAAYLSRKKVRIFWHCGRGYLDTKRSEFAQFCPPIFTDAGTNTAAVSQHFGVTDRIESQVLAELAWFDPHVADHKNIEVASDDERDWLDLVHASLSHYFKFQDRAPYIASMRRMATLEFGQRERNLVDSFRRNGMRYLVDGDTEAVRKLKAHIQRCADADRHVIVTGESGVGKEHVAHLLWERSPRAGGTLVAVNCALYAGDAHMANADLFGHKKGAFTGAEKDRKGKFVEANGGILFLDELAELPLDVQAKLLRVIEDGRVTPVGADQYETEVDVLILAATNRNLPDRIRQGRFRADLFHRLAILRIHVLPLRERKEDIQVIAKHRLETLAQQGHPRTLSSADFKALQAYDWPGNVRQLLKLIDRAVLLDMSIPHALAEEIALGDLLEDATQANAALLPTSKHQVRTLDEITKAYARHAWEIHDQNIAATAKALGIAENTLRYKLLQ